MVGPMCLAKGIFNSWPLFFTHLIISTDSGATSSTSESGLSTTSTQHSDYSMLREGGYEAPVISVDGEGLAGSGAGAQIRSTCRTTRSCPRVCFGAAPRVASLDSGRTR